MLHGSPIWRRRISGYNPDLGEVEPLEICTPPDIWYHGTCSTHRPAILNNGLQPRSHLTRQRSLCTFSARRAAARFGGDPISLEINIHGLPITLYGTSLDSETSQGDII